MFEVSSRVANLLFGFKQSRSGYPCYWCGAVTELLNAEDIHVCEVHQVEEGEVGYDAMKAKYPFAGKENRNLEFFKARDERYLARAKRLTKHELKLLIKRGCFYEQGYAKAILDGKTLPENEMRWLGQSAEQYIDDWGQ